MLTPVTKKMPPKVETKKEGKEIKTTISQDGDVKKIFMAAGETLLTALIGRRAAARHLSGLTKENIQKEKTAQIISRIINPELLRQRLRNQTKIKSTEQDLDERTPIEELSQEEKDALQASRIQDMGKDKGKNRDKEQDEEE